jgi:hypothetical protein
MEKIRANGCQSCTGKIATKSFRPYCSIVCSILGARGLRWRTGPCRIVDLRSGNTLTAGPEFDLTPRGLAQLQKQAERLSQYGLQQSPLASAESMAVHLSPQNHPQLISTFSGSSL